MLRKIKIVFIFAVAFKMFTIYSMDMYIEQEQQSCLHKMPYDALDYVAGYLPQKDICSLALTCRYLDSCVKDKRIFTGKGSKKKSQIFYNQCKKKNIVKISLDYH